MQINISDIVVIFLIAAIVIRSIYRIYKERKNGRKCMGCPSSGSCISCNCDKENNQK